MSDYADLIDALAPDVGRDVATQIAPRVAAILRNLVGQLQPIQTIQGPLTNQQLIYLGAALMFSNSGAADPVHAAIDLFAETMARLAETDPAQLIEGYRRKLALQATDA